MTSAVPAAAPPAADRRLGLALHQQVKGVAVITAGTVAPVGFCATSVAPVSLDPPLLSFAIDTRSASWAVIDTAEQVLVNLLAADQEDVARAFSRPGAAKFGPPTRWFTEASGLPALHGVLARLRVAPVGRFRLAHHALVIGRVTASVPGAVGKAPLVHYAGRYGRLAARDDGG